MARAPSTEVTPESGIRENVQMDPLHSTRQISKSQTRWIHEWERYDKIRSSTRGCHFTHTLSPDYQQHYNHSPKTCVEHPTCRWSWCMECSGPHYICSLQDSRSCHKNTAVDRWVGSSDQQNKDQATVFSQATLKEKITLKLWDRTLPQEETPICLGVKLDPRLSWKPQRNQEISPAEKN